MEGVCFTNSFFGSDWEGIRGEQMDFKLIDMKKWERAECYQHFMTVARSTYSITVDLDITEFIHYTQEKNIRIFPVPDGFITTSQCLFFINEFPDVLISFLIVTIVKP